LLTISGWLFVLQNGISEHHDSADGGEAAASAEHVSNGPHLSTSRDDNNDDAADCIAVAAD